MNRILEDVSVTGAVTEPDNETKADKFKRLGLARMTAALDKLRLIGNLSGAGYAYTDEQVDLMISTLRKEVDALEAKLKHVKVNKRTFEWGKN